MREENEKLSTVRGEGGYSGKSTLKSPNSGVFLQRELQYPQQYNQL